MKPILLSTERKEKNIKTFAPTKYVVAGIVLAGIGLFYFTTQFKADRIEEWLPLGISLLLGLYLILANRAKWKIPGSKHSFYQRDFIFDPSTGHLTIVFKSNTSSSIIDQTIALTHVTHVDIRTETSAKTQKETEVVQDVVQILPLGKATPTGVYTKTSTKTYRHTQTFMTLHPSEEEIKLIFTPSDLPHFQEKLNEALRSN